MGPGPFLIVDLMTSARRLLVGLALCLLQNISEPLLQVDLARISKTFVLVVWVFSEQVLMTLERLYWLD
jgi:hypothetical protein